MIEKIIKKDINEELEKILESKNVDEQAKNLLQGILYKVEVSYKDYKKVKVKQETEEKYVEKILRDVQRKCDKIKVVKLSQKLADEEIQQELEKNKFYVGEQEIVCYPIEEKILYAIEKKANNKKILNNKYGEATIAISNLINEGKNLDRIEVLRDFNGWSWTTIKTEIENIEANLIYQTLQILLGEEFLENWCQDNDGIVDYLEILTEEISKKYGNETANKMKNLLIKIAIANTLEHDEEYANIMSQKLQEMEEEINEFENTEEKIEKITNHKKQAAKELKDLEKILRQDARLKAEYEKRNEEAPIDRKIFNIRVFKQQLNNKKQKLLNEIEEANYLLNPTNYLEEKSKIIEQRKLLKSAKLDNEQMEKLLIEFEQIFLQCLSVMIKETTEQEEILKLIYKLRYFCVLPFNSEKSIKDIEQLETSIMKVEKQLVQKAISKKVIADVPLEVMRNVFETRIIVLEELYYKVTTKFEKNYVQIFDENVSEEKFEITPTEKIKINKKIKIFI